MESQAVSTPPSENLSPSRSPHSQDAPTLNATVSQAREFGFVTFQFWRNTTAGIWTLKIPKDPHRVSSGLPARSRYEPLSVTVWHSLRLPVPQAQRPSVTQPQFLPISPAIATAHQVLRRGLLQYVNMDLLSQSCKPRVPGFRHRRLL